MIPLGGYNLKQTVSLLYVEDEEVVRDEMMDILPLLVDDIYVAKNGKEALELYHKHIPDMVITDIRMPYMTGLEMIREIRKTDLLTPIIITSAFNDSEYLLEAIDLGIKYYVLKPVLLEKLQAKIEDVKKDVMQQRELDAYQLFLEGRVEEETALREAEEALLLSQNKDAELGQMVSVIAHQWKQPLHYLHLLIEDLGYEQKDGGLSEEFINEFTTKSLNKVNFLSDTMDNFLRFYKSDSKDSSFFVHKFVKDVSTFLSVLFKAVGVELEITVVNDFSLHGNRNEFQQIILNLLNNAKEAFEGKRKENAKISIVIDVKDDLLCIEISDNAGGIPEDQIPHIFGMDFTTKRDGNGIGLFLVKKIVRERFKGNIEVSNTDEGACFSLQFPKGEQ